jgi:hypothetical protein
MKGQAPCAAACSAIPERAIVNIIGTARVRVQSHMHNS